jgi:class 3 adenylate cyclase
MDIEKWLRGLGLQQYAATFRDNAIDAEVLPELTEADLEKLGVVLGHRKRLLKAIATLATPAPAVKATSVGPAPSHGDGAERRHLTVMFCDLVGSTALAARLDPEDLREVIGAYHRGVVETVSRFEGFVAKYMGDGVLVYFGYPQAHEDDAERAVRAGLALVDAIGRLDGPERLRVHVGIATGLVVVGDLVDQGDVRERAVVGETPNLAARLQATAEPDSVVIAATTHRLIGSLFAYADLGAVAAKGFAEPVHAWRVIGEGTTDSRYEALHGTGETPLVGRDEELELLLRRWAQAKGGAGRVVLLAGEPGIGKSRVIAAVQERIANEPHTRLRCFCSPHHQDSALHPTIAQLERAARFVREDTPETKLQKLEALLAPTMPPDEDVALLAALLSIPTNNRFPAPNLTPQRQKQKTFEALLRQLAVLARRQPVLMIFEDVHWIDPSSRELLDLIVERVRCLPVLLIVTLRPEFQPPWTGQAQVSTLVLNRLDRRDRTALVAQIAGGKALPDDVVDQIADRTDGVPLFVEELTKSVLQSGLLREETDRYVLDRALPPFAIPTTLHDSLMSRLDRLASVRHVAQIGAAIGREFSYALLRAVSHLSEEELQPALARLVASELVFQKGMPPDAVYAFRHALVQDAAHGSLLRSTRQQLHAQIAEALEADSPEMMENQPELFAQHYAEAELVEKSVACWGKAGHRSAARSALAEAAAQFHNALDQLALLPDNRERQRQELELCSALGVVLNAVKGFAAPETGHSYARARALWVQLGSPSEFLHVPFGLSRYHLNRGELDLAQRLGEDLLRLSGQRDDTAGLILGHLSCGRALMLLGRFASMIRSSTARLFIRPQFTPTCYHRCTWGMSSSVSAFPTKHKGRTAQQSPRLGGWLIRILWL